MADYEGSLIERIYYDQPERGWKTENKEHVVSIIFQMKEPVSLPRQDGDGRVISKEWVMLVEPKLLDQIQIASIDRNTPIGWQLDEKVYDEQPAHDKEAIKWFAEKYERTGYT